MRGVALAATLMLLVGVLAGCTDRGGGAESDSEDVFVDVPPPRAGTGLIRGVVVDGTITPVAGATVFLQNTDMQETTDDAGHFVLRDVEPGTHFIRVEKPGYTTTQQSVDVRAGVHAPPIVRVLIEVDPENRPYVVELVFRGFIECSLRTPALGLDCGVTDNAHCCERYEFETEPTFIQSELVWDSNQALSDHLAFMYNTPNDDVALVRDEGPSPLMIQADKETIQGAGFGPETDIRVRVFAASHPDTIPPCVVLCLWGAGATLEQEFQAFTHFFYNTVPEEGWRFTEHGSPPYTV